MDDNKHLRLRDVVVDYSGSVQAVEVGVAGILLAWRRLLVSDRDFNSSEVSSKARDKLGGLVVGNADMRELSQPRRTRYGMNILFGSRGFGKKTSASNSQRVQSSLRQTLLLYGREVAPVIDRV